MELLQLHHEEYFRELKQLILNNDRNLRIDKFLIKHIRSISGTEKLLNVICESIITTTTTFEKAMEFDAVSKSYEIEKSDELSIINETKTIKGTETITESLDESYSFLHEEENWKNV